MSCKATESAEINADSGVKGGKTRQKTRNLQRKSVDLGREQMQSQALEVMERRKRHVPEGLKVEHAANKKCTQIYWTEKDLKGPA